jgi:polysaccharide biosynthesis transport protein
MDEPFDFRPYADALLRRWRLIIGGTFLAGILAAGLSFLIPPTYEANALVLLVVPHQVVQFDPRFENVDESRPLPAYPQLASSDHLLQTLLAQIAPEVTEPKTLRDLRDTISVSAMNDPTLLRLTVHHRDPATAAFITNQWATLFVGQVNELLGDEGSQQLQFFQGQRDEAQRHLTVAEQALADFQQGNRIRLAAAELQALEDALVLLLAQQQNREQLQADIAMLRSQLAAREGGLLPADHVAVLLLYQRAYGDGQPASPIELQIDGTLMMTADRDQLIATLDTLQVGVRVAANETSARTAALEPGLLALQHEVEAMANDERRLRHAATLATERYTALAREVVGQEITAQDTRRGLRLASPAIIAEEPVAPRKLLNGVLAAVVALALFVAVTIFRQWHGE